MICGQGPRGSADSVGYRRMAGCVQHGQSSLVHVYTSMHCSRFEVAGQAGGACWLLVSGEQQREEDGGWEAGFKLVLRAFRGYRCQC
jgi:hypothetical protein